MTGDDRLEPYYFHEREFDSLDELREWFEWEVPDQFNVAEYICDRWARERPDRPAIHVKEPDGDVSTYSFAELQALANRVANFLAAEGVERGDRIAVSGTQCVETLAVNVAAYKLGAVAVPLSVLLGTDGLSYRLHDCEASAFVVADAAVDALRDVRDDVDSLDLVVTLGDFDRDGEVAFEDAVDGHSAEFETVETDAEEPAFMIYTSGTTGDPKGVVHPHRHVLGELPQYLSFAHHDIDEGEVTRVISEWSWIMSLPGLVTPALFYGVGVLACPSDGFDPEREFELVDEFGVTHLNLPPTAVRMMMQVDDPTERWDLSSLRSLITGGESAGTNIIQWVEDTFENAAFIEGYGTTEMGGVICDDPAMGYDHRLGYFGVPSVGHEFAVLDRETGEELEEPEQIGELAIKYGDDPALFTEYLNKPEATEDAIVDGWYRSGDLVSVDEDGYFRFHARDDDLIVSSGYRISPVEIEDALEGHPGVRTAGVVGVPHDTRGEIPKAFVVLADGYEGSDDLKSDLQSYVKENLAKYEYPRELAFVQSLPTTTTGKVKRKSLREREGVADE
ncbi:MAG: acyl-CoA synthetase [Halarchaeum sp.]